MHQINTKSKHQKALLDTAINNIYAYLIPINNIYQPNSVINVSLSPYKKPLSRRRRRRRGFICN